MPLSDSATLMPKRPLPISPGPVSFGPCWVQLDPERVKTQAAPLAAVVGPPADQGGVAVVGEGHGRPEAPGAELFRAGQLRALLGPGFPERVKTQAAPASELSKLAADQGGVAVGRQGHARAEASVAALTAAGQGRALLHERVDRKGVGGAGGVDGQQQASRRRSADGWGAAVRVRRRR